MELQKSGQGEGRAGTQSICSCSSVRYGYRFPLDDYLTQEAEALHKCV